MNTVFTSETNVVNTTTETEVFRTNLGSIRGQKLFRFKAFGVVNNNASLSNTIEFALYLNNTLVTYGLGTPDDGTPFLCAIQDLLFQGDANQLGNTILLNGESQDGNTDDGASHLHLNETTVDTSDESIVSLRITLGAANANFGVTIKSVVLEEIF